MSLLVNSAGVSAADPILKGLGFEVVAAASTMDVATFTNLWIDTASNSFPGTNAVTTTPGTSDVYHGVDLASDGAGLFTASSPHGLVVGDYIYMSHASITAGLYKIATVPLTTTFTLIAAGAPSNTVRTGITFEVAWRYQAVAGTAPSVSSGGGTLNYYKSTMADSAGNAANVIDQNYIADAPAMSGTTFLAGDSKALDGSATTKQQNPSLAVLSGWTNHGGVATVAFTNHSVQTGKTDFRHSDGTTAEKSLATATTNGMNLTAGDAVKYGAIQLRSVAASAVIVTQNLQITLDTTAPTLVLAIYAR